MTARSLALLLLTLFILPFSSYAQSGATGAITGVVVDSKGIPISNAQIDITFVGTTATREVFSDAGGNFTVPSLPVGAYDVVVKAAGFSTSKYNGVAVRLTETTRLNPSLGASTSDKAEAATGTGHEDVVMIATPPVVAVETGNPTTGRTVEADVIGALPLATQNFHQLLTLSAGAISGLNASAQLGRGDVGINVNGQRAGQ